MKYVLWVIIISVAWLLLCVCLYPLFKITVEPLVLRFIEKKYIEEEEEEVRDLGI